MPPKILALAISSCESEKLLKERVTPTITSESIVKEVFSPKKWASTVHAALLVVECPEGYSGCAGVISSGVQVGSPTVAGFPSVSPNGIAVTGLQAT